MKIDQLKLSHLFVLLDHQQFILSVERACVLGCQIEKIK